MRTIEWGFPIVSDLFLAGLSAGLFFISSLAMLLGRKGNPAYRQLAKYGAYLAPWPVMTACTILMFDLGHWWKFYKLYTVWRWSSPMSLGSWLLLAFCLLSLVYLFAWISEDQKRRFLVWILPVFPALSRDLAKWRLPMAWLGLPMSLGVGIYTGTLLSVMSSRPFWNTSLLPQMFLVSALASGCAALLLWISLKRGASSLEQKLLTRLSVGFLAVEGFLILPFVVYGRLSVQSVHDSMKLLFGGSFTASFWGLFFGGGLLLPLAIQIRQLALNPEDEGTRGSRMTAIAALAILQGSFVLRYVFVYAGQHSAF